jgi:acyl transferase domain-containing protein
VASGFAKSKRLSVSHAFHSTLMDPMLDEFRSVLESVSYNAPVMPVVSNVTGALADRLTDPEYWVEHVCGTVRFADGVAALGDLGVVRSVEVGPDAVLTPMMAESDVSCVPMLRGGRPEVVSAFSALGGLFTTGAGIDWKAVFAGSEARRIDLPTYPFQRQRFWLVPEPASMATVDSQFWQAVRDNDLDALANELAVPGTALESVLPALAAWHGRQTDQDRLDSWRYRIDWVPVTDLSGTTTGRWLVLAHGGKDSPLAAQCRQSIVDTVVLRPERTRQALAAQFAGIGPVAGVLSVDADLATTVRTVQALGDAGLGAKLWCVTSGAVSIGEHDPLSTPEQGQLWGLGRVVALEHGDRWGGLIDVPAEWDDVTRERFAAALVGPENQVAIRRGGAYGRRLVHAPAVLGGGAWSPPSGTVLITGGTGGLGARLARWMVERGVSKLVLTSRRGPEAPGAADLVAELAESGAVVDVVACDLADPAAVQNLVGGIPELTTVVHAAGVAADATIADVDPDRLGDVLDGKVFGAINLDTALADRALDAFVVFSSISGVWGSGGQAVYSAGNAFLDALVLNRRARGLAGTAVAWGPWADGGMVDARGRSSPAAASTRWTPNSRWLPWPEC